MAGYGWNSRLSNTHVPKRPHLPSQIACRICDHVFTSTQALIDHIESHMLEDDLALRRQHGLNLMFSPQTDPFANPSQLGLTTPTPLTQTLSFSQNGYHFPSFQDRNNLSLSQNGYNLPSLQDRNTYMFGATPHPVAPQSQLSFLARNSFDTIGSQHEPFTLQTHRRVMEEPVTDGTKPFLQQLEKPFLYKSVPKGIGKSDVEMLDLKLKL